ncbi:ATP-binding protein [Streptomyces sp. NPDC048383]|uniref:ATP-binding protein n=1 Tax=Streptomyces sp. NPDC048383 TaxID=3155386 RepID=UPI0034255488
MCDPSLQGRRNDMNPPAAANPAPGPKPNHGAQPAATTSATARRQVTELLRAAGSDLDGVAAVDALLVTSELVTNAIRHGGGITAFHATLTGDTLRLTVSDANPRHPVPHPTARGRPGGYGWPLIQRLTDHVDITPRPDGGKTITTLQRLT